MPRALAVPQVRDRMHAQWGRWRNSKFGFSCRPHWISRAGVVCREQACDQWSGQECRPGIFEIANSHKFDLPWGIETRMLDSLVAQVSKGPSGTYEMMDPLHPIGLIGDPEEVAELIVWLCSSRALARMSPSMAVISLNNTRSDAHSIEFSNGSPRRASFYLRCLAR